jgi:YD repeat-containing protein
LTEVIPPEGPSWKFSLAGESSWTEWLNGRVYTGRATVATVTLPSGGWVRYETRGYTNCGAVQTCNPYDPSDCVTEEVPCQWSELERIRTRTTGGNGIPSGSWGFEYGVIQTEVEPDVYRSEYQTSIAGPDTYQLHTHEQPWGLAGPVTPVREIAVGSDANHILERTQFAWELLREWQPDAGQFKDLVPTAVTTIRDGHTYGRTFVYGDRSDTGHLGHFGQPVVIDEFGDFNRRTDLTYQSFSGLHLAPRVNLERVSRPDGPPYESTFAYDAQGFLESKTIRGTTTTYERDLWGNIKKATDANHHATQFTYDRGVVMDTTTPEYTISREINEDGTVASETRGSRTVRYEYDRLGRQTEVHPPQYGHTTVTSYGDTWVRVSRGSSFLTTTFDGFGRPVDTENAVGVRTHTEYDAAGRKVLESAPYYAGEPRKDTTYSHDALGRIIRRWNPGGTSVSYGYGGGDDGLTVAITDEEDRTTTQTWAATGDPGEARLVKVVDAAGTTWGYSYDVLGALRQVSEPGNVTRTWDYDGRHRLSSESHPESGTTAYGYDAVGNLESRTEAFGTAAARTFAYGYDGNNRRTSAGDVAVTYEYDEADRRTRALRSGVVDTRFQYDADGRLEFRRDTFTAGGVERALESLYAYDDNDNVIRITYPSGNVLCYSHDAGNRIKQVWRGATAQCLPPADGLYLADGAPEGVAYHASGALASYTSGPLGQRFTYTLGFDDRQRPSSIAAPGILELGYTYDGVGNVTTIADARPGRSASFVYDNLDRLTSATGGWGSTAYHYDGTEGAAGNRTKQAHNGVETDFQYPPGAPRRLNQVGSAAHAWNEYGDLSDDGTYVYSYSPSHMLVEVTRKADQTKLYYGYDGDDQRLWYTPEPEQKSRYYARGIGGLLSEYQLAGSQFTWQVDYVYLGNRLLAALRAPDGPVAGAFNKSSPANGADLYTPSVTLTWTTSAGATSYEYCLSSSGVCLGTWQNVGNATSATVTLASGATYHWQVRARNDEGTMEAADGWWSFALRRVSADFNGDSKADLLWRNYATGENRLWYMDGATKVSEAELPPLPDTNWRMSAVADFNADGKPDIVWRHGVTGSNAVWFMDGAVRIGEAGIQAVTGVNWQIVAAADFTLDGKPDILWRNQSTGANEIWAMDGIWAVTSIYLPAVTDTDFVIAGAADFDGNGSPDILWRNKSTGANAVWTMSGTTLVGDFGLLPVTDTGFEIGTAADLDGNGKPDIVWRHRTTGGDQVWFMDGLSVTDNCLVPTVADTTWWILRRRW